VKRTKEKKKEDNRTWQERWQKAVILAVAIQSL
jgi:hypothetical protein